jgi:hypothetical protein
MTVSMTLGLE